MPDFPQINKSVAYNDVVQQGSSFERTINFGDFDITGFTFRGMIRRMHSDRRPIVAYDFNMINSSEISLALSPEKSSLLPAGILVHDIEMVYVENGVEIYVARILEGKLKVTPEVTR